MNPTFALFTGILLIAVGSMAVVGARIDAIRSERCRVAGGQMINIEEEIRCVKSIEYLDVTK